MLFYCHTRYHTFVKKTTIYLTDEIVSAIKTQAKILDCSEAQLIRSALEKEFALKLQDAAPNFGLVNELNVQLPNWDLSDLDSEMQGFGQ